MNSLRLSSCMGDHADSFCCAVTACLEAELSIPTEYVNNISWQEREHLFDLELIQICWMCGWPYVIKADRPDPKVELLVVPVPSGERYAGRPIYFSDVVVRSASPYRTFSDLCRGAGGPIMNHVHIRATIWFATISPVPVSGRGISNGW